MGRDGMSNNDGAPLSISALTSLCEQSKLFYATAVTSSPLTRGVACEAASGYLHWTQCPMCQQTVRLHVDKSGRRLCRQC